MASMNSTKKLALYLGILGSVATCVSVFNTSSADTQTSSGQNSPNINGNNNSINYGGLILDPEAIKKHKPNISTSQYAQLKTGMTYDEVLDIVKVPGSEAGASMNVTTYTWGTETYVYMTATFVDGKLQSKSQSGL